MLHVNKFHNVHNFHVSENGLLAWIKRLFVVIVIIQHIHENSMFDLLFK